jgi:hypothetical protein
MSCGCKNTEVVKTSPPDKVFGKVLGLFYFVLITTIMIPVTIFVVIYYLFVTLVINESVDITKVIKTFVEKYANIVELEDEDDEDIIDEDDLELEDIEIIENK